MDIVSPGKRSAMMARIRGKDTTPELRVRRAAHALGYRFRLHRRDLPGSPDLVFPRLRKLILVHGCYWHRHPGCLLAYTPKSNTEFWESKFIGNVERDRRAFTEIERLGWDPLVIWECETYDLSDLKGRIGSHLRSCGGR
jgi:DNA mismatch endonuclease (patch repair protein)